MSALLLDVSEFESCLLLTSSGSWIIFLTTLSLNILFSIIGIIIKDSKRVVVTIKIENAHKSKSTMPGKE